MMAFILLLIAACKQSPAPDKIDLNIPWKFHTGDDPEWAVTAFDDSRWEQIDPSKVWEEQGYKNYSPPGACAD